MEWTPPSRTAKQAAVTSLDRSRDVEHGEANCTSAEKNFPRPTDLDLGRIKLSVPNPGRQPWNDFTIAKFRWYDGAMKKIFLFALFVALVGLGLGAASVVKAQDINLAQLIEMFISLGIIPPEKAATARAALSNLNNQPAAPPAVSFARDLELGDRGHDVRFLQKVLNQNTITQIASSGAGSPGNETDYFGAGTRAAVIKFQELHSAEVLAPTGLARGTGYVGTRTIAKLNSLITGGASATPSGTTLTISAPATSAPSVPCTADIWSCSEWAACFLSGSQNCTCSMTFDCSVVTTPSPSTSQSCTPPPPSCTADTWSCTGWSACSSSGAQSRECSKTFDCAEANTPSPTNSQSCTPPPPACTADTWSCTDWSACSSSGSQTRMCNMTSDCGSANTPSPSTSQSCTLPYSDYNFNYQWSYGGTGVSSLSCPSTPRDIRIRKAVFEIPGDELQKLEFLRSFEPDGFELTPPRDPAQFIAVSNRVNSPVSVKYSLEEAGPNKFAYFGGAVPLCTDGASISIESVKATLTDIVDGRNVEFYLESKGIAPNDVRDTGNSAQVDIYLSGRMTEWDVWDYTTNRPVKID